MKKQNSIAYGPLAHANNDEMNVPQRNAAKVDDVSRGLKKAKQK